MKIIAANWKMNKTNHEAREFMQKFNQKLNGMQLKNVEIVICPQATALELVKSELKQSCAFLGAQNCSSQSEGALTGEISPKALEDLQCKYVILGHSERRQLFHESNQIINQKAIHALEVGLDVIMCIGETLEQKKQNQTEKVLSDMMDESLKGMRENQLRHVVIAYEPIWAIGSGLTPTLKEIEDVHKFIQNKVKKSFNMETKMKILYGGSVNPANSKEFALSPVIDGFLIGGASLDVEKFTQIIANSIQSK